MEIATATGVTHELGPLTKRVYGFVEAQTTAMAAGIRSPSDWNGMLDYIDADRFKRVGAYLEELDWEAYKQFLTGWMAGGTRFEFTEFQISEVGNSVFQEIEERHYRGDDFIRKNVIAVFRFDDQQRLYHLDIYEQAKDSGDWIKESARKATAEA
ncbi:MAG: hypothetical protein JF593_08700 [Novosphingobium sp.]|nr:hypothetical protein [Novosphingobium sp.]